ncbi:MAG TPA: hypothetical protein VJM33_10100, partial [Microthrixaceae bacterium]|nr:hypothetical protein [Microthrixaceae bacterium]
MDSRYGRSGSVEGVAGEVGRKTSSRSAISASRDRAACWYLIDAAIVECPILTMSSFVVAPVQAASVPAAWRRSWIVTPS